jgi:hypothetical protein
MRLTLECIVLSARRLASKPGDIADEVPSRVFEPTCESLHVQFARHRCSRAPVGM